LCGAHFSRTSEKQAGVLEDFWLTNGLVATIRRQCGISSEDHLAGLNNSTCKGHLDIMPQARGIRYGGLLL